MRNVFSEALGREIALPDVPHRIISFSPAVTEILFQLGLEDDIAGVSAFCVRPEGATRKKKVGSYNTTTIEMLRRLQPDLILTVTGYQREFAMKLAESFPVYAVELPISVTGILDMVLKVGLVAGAHDSARSLANSLLKTLGTIRSIKEKLKVYVEIDFTTPVSFGAYSYITDALSLLGAENIFGHEPFEWLEPNLLSVAQEDPDVILYEAKMFRPFSFRDLLQLIHDRGWGSMRAVALGSVFLTPGPLDFLAHHGPSFITEAMPWIAQKLSDTTESKASAV